MERADRRFRDRRDSQSQFCKSHKRRGFAVDALAQQPNNSSSPKIRCHPGQPSSFLSYWLRCSAAATPQSRPHHRARRSRVPSQKIDSQLLYELYRVRGQAKEKQVPPGPTTVRIDPEGRALVDVRAEVTPALEKKVATLGGTIRSTSREYRSILAWIPIKNLERLAEDPAVHAIVPAAEAIK
jgi:hypothetical protein